jgi:hypothetical protein
MPLTLKIQSDRALLVNGARLVFDRVTKVTVLDQAFAVRNVPVKKESALETFLLSIISAAFTNFIFMVEAPEELSDRIEARLEAPPCEVSEECETLIRALADALRRNDRLSALAAMQGITSDYLVQPSDAELQTASE